MTRNNMLALLTWLTVFAGVSAMNQEMKPKSLEHLSVMALALSENPDVFNQLPPSMHESIVQSLINECGGIVSKWPKNIQDKYQNLKGIIESNEGQLSFMVPIITARRPKGINTFLFEKGDIYEGLPARSIVDFSFDFDKFDRKNEKLEELFLIDFDINQIETILNFWESNFNTADLELLCTVRSEIDLDLIDSILSIIPNPINFFNLAIFDSIINIEEGEEVSIPEGFARLRSSFLRNAIKDRDGNVLEDSVITLEDNIIKIIKK